MTASWRDDALCAQVGGDVWFPEGQGGSANAAKRICDRCTVKDACLNYALTHDVWDGVWGGVSPKHLRRLRRERGLLTPAEQERAAVRERILELLAQEVDVPTIAAQLDVSDQTVYRTARAAA